MFGGFKIFGVTEWGARFFSAVFGVLTIFITYFYVKKYSSARQAFITSLVLLASSHFLFEFRMSVPDPYLIFFKYSFSFYCLCLFQERKKLLALALCNNNGIRNAGKRTCCHCITRRRNIYMVDLGKKIERNFFMENMSPE
jgi:hypothetical protein